MDGIRVAAVFAAYADRQAGAGGAALFEREGDQAADSVDVEGFEGEVSQIPSAR